MYFKMVKLYSKKTEKISVLRRKKFGRIDSCGQKWSHEPNEKTDLVKKDETDKINH